MKDSIIRQVPLFASLPSSEIEYLVNTLNSVEFAPGAVVFREGEYGDRFYIVMEGEIEIVKSMETADELIIAVRGPGNYVGEMSLFDRDGLRTASVRAHSPVRLMEMTRGDFDALLHRQPSLAYELVRELSNRLSDAHNLNISGLREKNRQLTEAYLELQAAQAGLVEKERLEHELTVARRIQESILPSTLPQLPGMDLGARLIPTRAVGGDLFDMIDLGHNKLGIAVADVSDKGVPAAIFMALTRSLLRAEAGRADSPSAVVQNVNRVLLDMNEAGMFVTLFYGIVDCASGAFDYVRAGHEMPVIISAEGQAIELKRGVGQPLALFEDPVLDEQHLRLSKPSTLIVYTDGVTDQNDEQGNFYGMERLIESICKYRHLASAQELCDKLVNSVNAFRGSASQTDDITFAVAQIR